MPEFRTPQTTTPWEEPYPEGQTADGGSSDPTRGTTLPTDWTQMNPADYARWVEMRKRTGWKPSPEELRQLYETEGIAEYMQAQGIEYLGYTKEELTEIIPELALSRADILDQYGISEFPGWTQGTRREFLEAVSGMVDQDITMPPTAGGYYGTPGEPFPQLPQGLEGWDPDDWLKGGDGMGGIPEMGGEPGMGGTSSTLLPRDQWPEGFYPVWSSSANLGLGAYVWEIIPGYLSAEELSGMTEAERLYYELQVDKWKADIEQQLWERRQYGEMSDYQQGMLDLQQQEFEWRQQQDGQLSPWQEEQLSLSREQLEWQREQYGDLSAWQQAQIGLEERQYGELSAWQQAQVGLEQQQFGELSAWQQAQMGLEEQELAWRQEQHGTLSAWQEEQLGLAREELALEQRNYEAQLAAQPHSWLEYSKVTGETPVIQPWMPPLMHEQYPELEGLKVGQPIPGWQGLAPQGQLGAGAVGTQQSPYQETEMWTGQMAGARGGAAPASISPFTPSGERAATAPFKRPNYPPFQYTQQPGQFPSVTPIPVEQRSAGMEPGGAYGWRGETPTTYRTRPGGQPAPTPGGQGGGIPLEGLPISEQERVHVAQEMAKRYGTERGNSYFGGTEWQQYAPHVSKPYRPSTTPIETRSGRNIVWDSNKGWVSADTGLTSYEQKTLASGGRVRQPSSRYTQPASNEMALWGGATTPTQYRPQAGGQVRQPIPSWPEPEQMPELLRPSRQYQARMGPTALGQYTGYEQMRTGIRPEELEFRLWSMAPPGGRHRGLSYVR